MKCRAAVTVWVHAMSRLKPSVGIGPPASVLPITSSVPGMVVWTCQKRLGPCHGKCGLPITRPRPSSVASPPKAQPLEPTPMSSRSGRSIAEACDGIPGGAALAIAGRNGIALASSICFSVRRSISSVVIGLTHDLPRHSAGMPSVPASRRKRLYPAT